MNTAAKALAQTSLGAKSFLDMIFLPQQFTLVLLSLAVFFSGLGVVYMKDLNRRLYHDLQVQQTQYSQLQTQWGQLLLEQSTLSMQARVENIATNQLQMVVPQQKDIQMVAE